MLKKTLLTGTLMGIFFTFGSVQPTLATDYQALSLTELDAMRGSMALADPAERDAFRSARRDKIQSLSFDERSAYRSENSFGKGNGAGNGNGSRLRDGSGAGSMRQSRGGGGGGGSCRR